MCSVSRVRQYRRALQCASFINVGSNFMNNRPIEIAPKSARVTVFLPCLETKIERYEIFGN